MKKIYKYFSLILLLFIALFSLSACVKSDNPVDPDPPVDQVTTANLTLKAKTETNTELKSDNSNYATLPDLTNDNPDLEFSGWALSEDGDVVLSGSIKSINYNTIKTLINNGSVTLYAVYKDTSISNMEDFAGEVKLDMTSNTLKQEVTVKNYVDGDTTHFFVPTSVSETGVLKARYLAVNTPESTGKIEEYGKTASYFTKDKLLNAVSIVVESDDDNWNIDSTGSRFLVWIWYKASEDSDYRNLNIELLQNGLAIASNSANNRYGETCVKAINQAKDLKLNIYSGQKDPNFYYGDAVEITLAELRQNIENYNGIKVAFEANVIKNYSNTAYVEEYDEETNMYYGISVYYGATASGDVINILSTGNRVRIVGSVQFYETGGTYQVSGITYRAMKPNDPNNTQMIESGVEAANVLTEAQLFSNGKVSIERYEEDDDGEEQLVVHEYSYASLAMNSSIEMHDLRVVSIHTTVDESSSSLGAMTMTCKVGDIEISVRTVVLYDAGGNLVTQDAFEGKTIDVIGLVDYYNGSYQIKVFAVGDITIK